MGIRGRKSAAELAIRPALRARSACPKVPRHLREDGAAFFHRMADEYDITDAGAVAVLSRAAECVDRIAAAQASIAERGEIVSNQYGEPKMNPACTLEKQARDGFFAAMRLLNLDEPPAVREAPWEIRR